MQNVRPESLSGRRHLTYWNMKRESTLWGYYKTSPASGQDHKTDFCGNITEIPGCIKSGKVLRAWIIFHYARYFQAI